MLSWLTTFVFHGFNAGNVNDLTKAVLYLTNSICIEKCADVSNDHAEKSGRMFLKHMTVVPTNIRNTAGEIFLFNSCQRNEKQEHSYFGENKLCVVFFIKNKNSTHICLINKDSINYSFGLSIIFTKCLWRTSSKRY